MMRFAALRLFKDIRGATAVEMAFALPLFLLFLFGIIGASHLYWVYNSMQFAADQAGRYAMLQPSATNTELTNIVLANMYSVNTSALTVTSPSDGATPTANRTINLTYNYTFLNGLGGIPVLTLTTTTNVPVIP